MTSTEQRLQEAAGRNAALLQSLHETDSAPSQLHQQIQYLKDLEAQLRKTELHVTSLKEKTAAELKDHKKYSESTLRRFAHKASGREDRFEEKAAKEERDYFDAIQQQKTAEDELAYIRQLKAEGETTKREYEARVRRREELQRELDNFYSSMFGGHTPGFPEEDELEAACAATMQHMHNVSSRLEQEHHILFLLGQMATKLTEAREHLHMAYKISRSDMLGGGVSSSVYKRNYLEKAESAIAQVRMLQGQLAQTAPHASDLGQLNIASGSIWGDVVFDNIFTDMGMHGKIGESRTQVESAGQVCGDLVKRHEGREEELRRDLEEAGARVREARATLQRVREAAFRKVAGEGAR